MGKFRELSLRGKIFHIARLAKEFGKTHRKAEIPSSKYRLSDLIHMEQGYISMERNIGEGTILIIRKFFSEGESVLDMPCGSACHAKHFIDYGLDYYGMDLSESAISLAMLKYPTYTFFNLSIYDTPQLLLPGLFDNVYCCSLLEHIGNWELALDNMLLLAKNKVVIGFYQGLSSLKTNYYEFHPFTDKNIVKFKITPAYGYKPVVSPQRSNVEAYVFQQPGNYRMNCEAAALLCNISIRDIMSARFDFDQFTKTAGMRLVLLYAQNNNPDFERYIKKVPGFIEKRKIAEDEIGYFMNRFSKEEFLSFLQGRGLKYELIDYKRPGGDFATFVIMEKV